MKWKIEESLVEVAKKLGRIIEWKMEEESVCNRSWGRMHEVEESSRRLENL